MSSGLSAYGQLPTHSRFFIAVNSNNTAPSTITNPSDPTIAAFTLGALLGPVALGPSDITTDAAIIATSGYTTAEIVQGTLFRDLGRKVIIAQPVVSGAAPSIYLAIYRQMQVVNGPLVEGIPAANSLGTYPTVYVKVWSADGSETDSVCVARTG